MNPFLAPDKARPIVVGHRGVPRLHQENTLAGFRRAAELGIPAVELDVRLTADRRAICVHDADLERLTGTTAEVSDLTWDQIRHLEIRRDLPMGVGPTGGPVTTHYDRPERIPLLEEVLAEIAHAVAINVELKLSRMPWETEVGEIVAELIARANAQHRVIVTSFDPLKLRAAAHARPELAVGLAFDDGMLDFSGPLLDPSSRRQLLGRLIDTGFVSRLVGARVVGVEHTLIGPRTVALTHARGLAIGTHTLLPIGSTTGKPIAPTAVSPAEIDRLRVLGVDWIETDDPEHLMERLHR